MATNYKHQYEQMKLLVEKYQDDIVPGMRQIIKDLEEKRVEVVRCCECSNWDKATVNKKGFLICPASGMEIMAHDYCSYGERRTDVHT